MSNKKQNFKLSRNNIICLSALAAILVLVIVMVILDQVSQHKLYLKNETDKRITDLCVYFEDVDGNIVDNLFEGPLDVGESLKLDYYSDIIYRNAEYECVMLVTFEGEEELVISDGTFNSNFGGNIRLRFFKKDGDYYLHTKAGLGLFESSKTTDMDTDIIMYFDENDWDYVI